MKKLIASVAMSVAFAGASIAGGLDDAEVEGEPFVVEEAAGSLGSLGGSGGAVIGGVLLLALLAAGLGDDDDDDSTGTTGQ